jgi:hypothetical protein
MSKSTKPAVAPAASPVAISTPVFILTKPGFNPKKPNSMSAARYALYASNPTVEGYIAACVALGQPNAQRNARADIAWDAKHGFISLTKPTDEVAQ